MQPVQEKASTLGSLKQNLTLRFGLLLALFLILILVSYMVISSAIDAKEHDSVMINLAGRQRMLSQKYATEINLVLIGLAASDREPVLEQKKAAARTAELFELTHRAFLEGGYTLIGPQWKYRVRIPRIENPGILEYLANIGREWAEMKRVAEMALSSEPQSFVTNEYLHLIQVQALSTLNEIEHFVTLMQRESEMKLRQVKKYQLMMAGTGGLLFGMIMVFVYWKIVKPLDSSMQQIKSKNQRLSSEITERKRAEEELRKLSHAIRQSPVCIVITDRKGDIEYVNPKFTELTGYTYEEAIGQNPGILRSGEHLPEFYKQLWDTITSGEEWKGEFHNKKKNGELYWEDASISPVTNEEGEITHYIAVKEDITERKRAEERLRRSEEKYRTLFEESKDAVFMGTTDGKVLDCNHAFVELLGFSSKEELLEIRDIRQLYYDANDRDVFKREIAKNGFVKNFEVVLKRTDGAKVFALHTANVIRDENGVVASYQSIIRDMTGYKALEQQLLQAQKMEAIGQLTGGIAHDFNNMLMVIIMHTESIQMLIKEDDPLKAKVERIAGVAKKAAGLTQRLLAFGRKQIFCLSSVDINDIVREAEELLLRLIGEDINLTTSLTKKKLTIMADSGQIEQVFMNLAVNARDAMPNGGSLVITTRPVTLDDEYIRLHGYGEPGSYACITVGDTGTGMDEKTKEKLFEPFFTTKEVGKGTGLGLSVVYGIVKQHNGYINVYSEPGTGTEFRVYFPVVESAVVEVEEEFQRPAVSTGGAGVVLLAEDDADIRELTKIVLEDCGYEVIDAVDGNDAIEKFMENKERIRLLLLDVIMPGKNGKEVYDAVRAESPEARVLFLSGYTEDIIRKTGIVEGGVKLVSKPVTPRELLSSIREVLAN